MDAVELTTEEREVLEAVREGNPWYFEVLTRAVGVALHRSVRYVPDPDDYFLGLRLAATVMRRRFPDWRAEDSLLFDHAIKLLRRAVSPTDFDDESVDDTNLDAAVHYWMDLALTEEGEE